MLGVCSSATKELVTGTKESWSEEGTNPKKTILPFRYQRIERLKGAGHKFSLLSEMKSCKLEFVLSQSWSMAKILPRQLRSASHVWVVKEVPAPITSSDDNYSSQPSVCG